MKQDLMQMFIFKWFKTQQKIHEKINKKRVCEKKKVKMGENRNVRVRRGGNEDRRQSQSPATFLSGKLL